MGSIINPVQVLKLKKIGLDIQYIFMLDKDKDITFIMEKSKINNIKTRDVKIMIDKDDILKNKDSPTDYNKEIFLKLFNDYIYSIKEVLTL
jgi:DNA primase